MYLLLFWLILSIFSLIIVNLHLKFSNNMDIKHERTIIRKYFHFLAIIVYTSGILIDTHLLIMCSVAFIVLLLLLEVKIYFDQIKFLNYILSVYENKKYSSIWRFNS